MIEDTAEVELLPRRKAQGYRAEDLAYRREWLKQRTGASLDIVGAHALDSQSMRGNIENPIGAAQVPLGVVGPLLVKGEHAQGSFYVPMATTEGAMLRSYERGMVVLTRSGGVQTRVIQDENRASPVFYLPDIGAAGDFIHWIRRHETKLRELADATTGHGHLLRLECAPVGRQVIVSFTYSTGDAHGMNMLCKATEAACHWIIEQTPATHYIILSGHSGEKRATGGLLAGGKGKKLIAGAVVPDQLLRHYLRTDAEEMQRFWNSTVLAHFQAASLGHNAQLANGLTALFIATGQDVANVVNSAVGIISLERTREGDLHVSVTLPSLTVATVGGGTHQGTARECLDMLDCLGTGKARKLAEITAASLLAGELSMSAALATGEFVNAHENYGRNRP